VKADTPYGAGSRVFVGRPDLAVAGHPEAQTVLQRAPLAFPMLTVQVPLPDEVRETDLPALPSAEAVWADQWLRQKGLR
jgi:hypothetical protein